MVAVSLSIEAWAGLTWPLWKRWVTEVEQHDFAGLFRSEHFTFAPLPARDAPELTVSLAYLADHTTRVHFGPLVAPVSFRDPVILARQAASLDALSDGRMILGVGAGGMQLEHDMFGYDLGTMSTRMDRLEEALEVITRLFRSEEPVSFTGRFYQLRDAVLRPPRPGGPPILIGGNGLKRTLPLVARYADIWNGTRLTPEEYQAHSAKLDELLRTHGRQPADVKRTATGVIVCGRTTAELERRISWWRRALPGLATAPLDTILDHFRSNGNLISGSPDEVVEQIRAYGAAGAAEMLLQWFTLDDFEGLELLVEHVLPYV